MLNFNGGGSRAHSANEWKKSKARRQIIEQYLSPAAACTVSPVYKHCSPNTDSYTNATALHLYPMLYSTISGRAHSCTFSTEVEPPTRSSCLSSDRWSSRCRFASLRATLLLHFDRRAPFRHFGITSSASTSPTATPISSDATMVSAYSTSLLHATMVRPLSGHEGAGQPLDEDEDEEEEDVDE